MYRSSPNTAERHGSNANKIRISERPAEPGRNSFRLWNPQAFEPVHERTT
jgi:hypothetical protein